MKTNNKLKFTLTTVLVIFVTSTVFGFGPATVDLGAAGDYVILAKTGISTTGNTSIVGNIGISPASATSITGFGLIMDPSGTYSTSSLVTGHIYAADYTEPTPTNLTSAVSNMLTAYADAAGRLNPDYTELYAGYLTGHTFVPGLYKWSSGILIDGGGITISGGPDDVWIFQIAQNMTISDGTFINLIGGADPENIFWQIAGQATIGTTSQAKGIFLSQTLVSMNTGATLTGRLFTQTAVTFSQNSVVQPNDPTGLGDNETPQLNLGTSLKNNYPNPFYPMTTIKFNIAKNESGILTIYNLKGKTLVKKAFDSGESTYDWHSEGLPSGLYLYRLQTKTQDITKKMILIK